MGENIESVLAQTYKNLEIIYVCDGCTDHTVNILRNYEAYDSRLIVYIEQKNLGAAAARNTGMAMAKGDWIIFLDSDDLFAADMIEIMHEQAVKEEADVCCCFWESFDEQPVHNGYVYNEVFKRYCKTYPVIKVLEEKKRLLQLVIISPCNKLIHRRVYEKEEVYFQTLPNCDDAYFSFVAFIEASKIVYVDKVLFYYRSNIGRRTLTTEQNGRKNYVYEAYDGFYQYLSLKDDQELKQSFYNRVCRDIYVLFGTKLYEQLFSDLRNIYFNKWEMQRHDVFEKLSYFHREIYKRIRNNDLDLSEETLRLQAKKNFVRDMAKKGGCSIWGCGYLFHEFLGDMNLADLGIQHLFDSDPKKWGIHIAGKVIEKFDGEWSDCIIVTSPQYYEEIKMCIGGRAGDVVDLEKEIWMH